MTRNNFLVAGFVILLLAISASTFIGLTAWHRANHSVVTNCEEIGQLKAGLGEIIQEAQKFSATSPVRSAVERERQVQFYDNALTKLAPVKC